MKKDPTGEKIKKILKQKHEKLKGNDGVAISNKIFQRRNPGFIPEQEAKVISNDITESVNYDMNNIKHLFGYNKKTQ